MSHEVFIKELKSKESEIRKHMGLDVLHWEIIISRSLN